ncbi:MAG TPA: hypothetical protein PKD27_02400, partial [Tepidiformaceae bacterium]|nr:hypothetical protein [Tepidiformaceae bacterium]
GEGGAFLDSGATTLGGKVPVNMSGGLLSKGHPLGATGIANRTMFKFGLRNIPRRGLQSVLVITGLALATLITTAAFVTGDTVDNSLTKDSEKVFGASDIDITWTGEREWIRDSGVAVEGGQVLM